LTLDQVDCRQFAIPMIDYRFYKIDANGKVFEPPLVLRLSDDGKALLHGRTLVDHYAIDIWAGARRVGTIPIA
jgi:hypothetical protein